MGKWIAIGCSLGLIVGVMNDEIAMGMGIGVALGAALETAQRK